MDRKFLSLVAQAVVDVWDRQQRTRPRKTVESGDVLEQLHALGEPDTEHYLPKALRYLSQEGCFDQVGAKAPQEVLDLHGNIVLKNIQRDKLAPWLD